MSCSNDPQYANVTLTTSPTITLTCTNGQAILEFPIACLDNVRVGFRSTDTTPQVNGVVRTIGEAFEITPHSTAFLSGRKATLTLPHIDITNNVKAKVYQAASIVDPNGWTPIPGEIQVNDRQTSVLISNINGTGQYVVVEVA